MCPLFTECCLLQYKNVYINVFIVILTAIFILLCSNKLINAQEIAVDLVIPSGYDPTIKPESENGKK